MKYINGLIGCALGFLGGSAVLAFALPADVVEQTVDMAAPAEAGEPFVKVVL